MINRGGFLAHEEARRTAHHGAATVCTDHQARRATLLAQDCAQPHDRRVPHLDANDFGEFLPMSPSILITAIPRRQNSNDLGSSGR